MRSRSRGWRRRSRCARPALSRRSCCSRAYSDAEQLPRPHGIELDLVVHQAHAARDCSSASARHAPGRLWLKVDTGMNRLGFRPEDFRAAWRAAARRSSPPPPQLRVLTHLAGADEEDGRYTAEQLARLRPLIAGLERGAEHRQFRGDPRAALDARALGASRAGAVRHLAVRRASAARSSACGPQ